MPPKDWLEFKIEVPYEFVEPVAELFRRYGKGGVAIEEAGGWDPDLGESQPPRPSAVLRTYMPQTPGFRSNREIVHIGVQLISKITDLPPLEEREIKEREWEEAWKAHFTPLRVGKHLLVQPPWHRDAPKPDDVVIEIDPGLAFGTGHHPTTQRTLESMERLIKPGDHVLDVGSGSGILSVGAAKLGAGKVIGVELDKIALKAGRANLRSNHVSGTARFYGGTLPSEHVPEGWADLVLANVNSVALGNLAPELRRALKPGGWLVGAGILEERLADVEEAFAAVELTIRERIRDDDWVALLV
ncbi:MAG: 50S ribosomal protein L11 methyltransferase, partial [Dehalococcoidia bacterium]